MKQFRKWLDTQESEYIDTNDIAIEDAMAEKTWRAALKWVKQDCIYTEDDGHECTDQEMIDKELKNE